MDSETRLFQLRDGLNNFAGASFYNAYDYLTQGRNALDWKQDLRTCNEPTSFLQTLRQTLSMVILTHHCAFWTSLIHTFGPDVGLVPSGEFDNRLDEDRFLQMVDFSDCPLLMHRLRNTLSFLKLQRSPGQTDPFITTFFVFYNMPRSGPAPDAMMLKLATDELFAHRRFSEIYEWVHNCIEVYERNFSEHICATSDLLRDPSKAYSLNWIDRIKIFHSYLRPELLPVLYLLCGFGNRIIPRSLFDRILERRYHLKQGRHMMVPRPEFYSCLGDLTTIRDRILELEPALSVYERGHDHEWYRVCPEVREYIWKVANVRQNTWAERAKTMLLHVFPKD